LEEIKVVELTHQPEDGEVAHAALKITVVGARDLENTKTAIIDRLWRASYGPSRHICHGDDELAPHPSEGLIEGPKGAFIQRAGWRQRWCMFRFRICTWFAAPAK
jgi:hypothetical protein